MTALLPAFRALPAELQQAAGAAGALALAMFLPWYEKSYSSPSGRAESASLSAFGVFSFVEAAVLLVAAAVLYLVWARARRKGFHLPGGDGTAIMVAGLWVGALLVFRLFDKPDVDDRGATVGIQWGIFGALAVAGLLAAAGARVRAADRPEPPNAAADDAGWERPPRAERPAGTHRRPAETTAVTEVLHDPPAWEGDVPEPPPRRGRRRRRGAAESESATEDQAEPPTDRLF